MFKQETRQSTFSEVSCINSSLINEASSTQLYRSGDSYPFNSSRKAHLVPCGSFLKILLHSPASGPFTVSSMPLMNAKPTPYRFCSANSRGLAKGIQTHLPS